MFSSEAVGFYQLYIPEIALHKKKLSMELKIKNVKRIKEEITLSEFAFVNYFVGENGSGKTSILNSISFLKGDSNSRHFFGPESVIQLKQNEKRQFLLWNNENPNKTEHKGDLEPNIYVLFSNVENARGQNGLRGIANMHARIGISDAKTLENFNSFLEEIGVGKLIAKKFIDQMDPFNQDNGRLIFENESGAIDPLFIADGFRVKHNLKSAINNWINQIDNPNLANLFIIEEPENNLHPKLQKEIPTFLNDVYKSIDPKVRKNMFFFISTHSPFIISSSANYENQKVYPLENGTPLMINFQTLSWTPVHNSKGYSGSECAYVVSKMLGADITDIGYPENYCILEEHSLQIILDDARNKGIIKNIQFVSTSGVTKSLSLSEKINELEKLNTLIKCNPYYWDKY